MKSKSEIIVGILKNNVINFKEEMDFFFLNTTSLSRKMFKERQRDREREGREIEREKGHPVTSPQFS